MKLFVALNREGSTVIQVSHSAENARYGSRAIELRDGWLSGDSSSAVKEL